MIRNAGIVSGRKVAFRLRDVICPEQEEIFRRISTEIEVTGRVVLISHGGEDGEDFAVIQAAGILCPLVVPLRAVKAVTVELPETGTLIRPKTSMSDLFRELSKE